MATQVQLRRGTAAQNDAFTGAVGEVTYDSDNDTLRVHDGGAAGGYELAKSNLQTHTNIDINSGTIDGTVIGGSTPAAISGTTGSFSGNLAVDTNTLFVDAANNRVGVGTSSPTKTLDVRDDVKFTTTSGVGLQIHNDSSNQSYLQFTNTVTGETSTSGFQVGIDGAEEGMIWHYRSEPIKFATGNTERMRIDSSGNVGIGGTTANAKLNVFQSLSGTYGSAGLWVTDNATTSLLMNNTSSGVSSIWSSGSLAFGSGTNDFTERMRIDSSGRVGIGTNSPGQGLHLNETGTGQVVFAITNADTGSGNNDGLHLGLDANENALFFNKENTAAIFATNNTERMRIDASGNLLVGTTSLPGSSSAGCAIRGPSEDILKSTSVTTSKNQVVFYNPNGAVGSINTSGSATTYNTSSDYRLKEDVQPMVGSADRLMALKPVNFAWKVDGSRVDGFLAHEAQEVVPECVTGEKDAVDKHGKPEYQGIDQSKLVPLLTAALQEALQKIETLEARVAALEA